MWARYMIAVTAGQPNGDFPLPSGISFADIDKTSGGLATPYCPPNLIEREAFKTGTEPSQTCPLHLAVMPTTVVPMYDEFGNLITTDTATMTDTTATYVPPVPSEPTLTGGVFRTDTAPPPTTTTVSPPPPPPTTTTVSPTPPPSSTDTTGTSPPDSDGVR